MVRLLLQHDVNVNATAEERQTTPLHLASFEGDTEMVGMLVDAGADLEEEDKSGNTPLFTASLLGNPEAARCLLGNRLRAGWRRP